MKLSRRQFVRNIALAAAAAAAAGDMPGAIAATKELEAGSGTVKWHKAPCRFCGTGCHVNVAVDSARGRVVGIRGDAKADVNKGLLCVKGYHVGLALYGKDRLTTPLLRKNGKLTPISWDEAIGVVAKRITADTKGFAIYGSGQWTIPEGYAAQKFIKGGLSNNHIDPNARLCMASAVTGFIAAFGVDESSDGSDSESSEGWLDCAFSCGKLEAAARSNCARRLWPLSSAWPPCPRLSPTWCRMQSWSSSREKTVSLVPRIL